MRLNATSTLVLILLAGHVAWSCGRGLKYTVDDAVMEPIPAGERPGVLDARKDMERAQTEKQVAENQLFALTRDQELAEKEKQQAQLEVEKALAEQEGAKASRNESQAIAAAHNKDLADLGLKVSEAKLDWLDEKKSWMRQAVVAAQAHIEAASARLELEKAKVAQQKGVSPSSGFDPSDYEGQWKGKNSKWQSEKSDAESDARDVKNKEQRWKDLATQQQKLKES